MGIHDQCAGSRAELGVYLLGAIKPSDRAAVDQHLAACRRCREELASLAGLPALLRRVPDGQLILNSDRAVQQMPAVRPEALLRRVAKLRRRNRALVAAAAAALIAGAAVAAVHGGPQSRASSPRVWEATIQAISPATRAWASVRYAHRRWGTDIEAQITGVPPGTRCQLWVTGARGQRVPAGSWTIAAGGSPLWYPASASLPAASLRSFAITTSQGSPLVTIAAQARPGSASLRLRADRRYLCELALEQLGCAIAPVGGHGR